MQSVVTGQALITRAEDYLRKKQIKKIMHTITETNRVPQTKIKR